jgi:S1-C subfamily serine protease
VIRRHTASIGAAALLAASAALASPPAAAAGSPDWRTLGPVTVEVTAFPSDFAAIFHTSWVRGSGFYLPDGDVVTCYHVVEHAHLYIDIHPYATPAWEVIHFHIAAADPAQDLALLAPNAGWSYTWSYTGLGNPASLVPGTPLAVLGHPWGGAWAAQPVTYIMRVPHELVDGYGLLGDMLLLHGHTAPGDSGAPVMTSSGQIMGVLESATPGHPWAYAVPISDLQFLGVRGPGW